MRSSTIRRSYIEATQATEEEADAVCPFCETAMRHHLWIDDLRTKTGGPKCMAPITKKGKEIIEKNLRLW